MPNIGVSASGCMHTPTTTMRLCAGATRISSSIMPGTPTASNTAIWRSPPTRVHAANAVSSRGSTTSWAPIVTASARRAGERSAATIGATPSRRRAAITARPTGPQPTTTAPSPACSPERLTACRPTAIGSVSAACVGARPFGTGSVSSDDSSMRSL